MTREQLDVLESLAEKATPGPWELECPIDDDNPWIVEAGKPTHEWRCLAMVTKSGDDINATEGNANADLLIGLRNNAAALIAAAREALELREALEFAADFNTTLVQESDGSYLCWRTDAWGEVHQYAGATPLEAINKARRGM